MDFTSLEQAHYDRGALQLTGSRQTLDRLRQQLIASPVRLSYARWLEAVRSVGAKQKPQRVLDYCAGLGIHSVTLQQEFPEAEVDAIDISAESLRVGQAACEQMGLNKRPRFLQMDGHKLEFPDNHFDLVSDFGSFSSLEFEKALSEIHRVLRPGGALVGVETFAHNPIANFRRQIRVLTGSRTQWCRDHIMDVHDLERMLKTFRQVKVEYHIFFSLALGVLPFAGPRMSEFFGRFDAWFLNRLGLLKKYAFKVVFTAIK